MCEKSAQLLVLVVVAGVTVAVAVAAAVAVAVALAVVVVVAISPTGSGNATGTDEAFAAGVAEVPGAKLELVLPTPGMGRSRRPASANCLALDDLPLEERHHLARESFSASPENHRLFYLYLRGQSGNPAYAKAQYLVRDALKVIGSPARKLAPANVALFFVNNNGPSSGGTAHTIRLCERHGVPVFTQRYWLA